MIAFLLQLIPEIIAHGGLGLLEIPLINETYYYYYSYVLLISIGCYFFVVYLSFV